MTVLVDSLDIANLNFDIIGNYEIVDPLIFATHATEGLFEFRVYTIGTFMKTNSPNRKLKVLPGQGIWVG